MKERLLHNWTWVRIAYLAIGVLVLLQAFSEEQWWGVGLGGYVLLMGLFGFGCAGGSCATGSCEIKPDRDQKK